MPNWGAEIPVTIVDRKPVFFGDYDLCDVAVGAGGNWCGGRLEFRACQWNWNPAITAIKLLADHPYYTKENAMVISREAAIEALKRLSVAEFTDLEVRETMRGFMKNSHELAKAIEEHWIDCPEKRPVDNRVIAMSYAIENAITNRFHQADASAALAIFDAKLAELEVGK